MRVPNFPTIPNLNGWKMQVGKNLVTASGRTDRREIGWWGEVCNPSATFETLEDSGEERFLSLDLKLPTALSLMLKSANNAVTRQVVLREHTANMNGRMLKGRQIAWLIYKHLQTNPNMGVLYNITDLGRLEWRGDKDVDTFVYVWTDMLTNVTTSLTKGELAEILLTKMEKSVALKEDVAYFNRLASDHLDRTYDYLINSIERYQQRERYRANRSGDLLSHLTGGT